MVRERLHRARPYLERLYPKGPENRWQELKEVVAAATDDPAIRLRIMEDLTGKKIKIP